MDHPIDFFSRILLLKKHLWKVVLTAFIVCMTWSGLTVAFGYWQYSLWPWNKAWFVFSSSHHNHYKIQVWGIFEDGENKQIDMSQWFTYPVGGSSTRYNEIGRHHGAALKLANFVCDKINTSDTKNKIKRIAVLDAIWRKQKGVRPKAESVDRKDINYHYYVRDHHCKES